MRRWSVRPVDVVLGTVPDGRAEEAERLLRDDAAFRTEVQELRRTTDAIAATLGEGWAPVPPPPLDTAAAFAVRPPRDAPGWRERLTERTAGLRSRPVVLRPAFALAAAAVLLAGGGALGALVDGGAEPPTTATVTATAPAPVPAGRPVALRAVGDAGPQRAAVSLPETPGGEVQLRVTGAKPSRSGEHYELWLLDDAEHLTSVGTFRVGADGVARGSFPIGVDAMAYKYVDVSVEPDDGNPAHSRRSVLRSPSLS